ncbi:methylenetetrahydrofolate reductase [Desulfovibrio sp. OttesenSCG-928-I05]|nr:methylenetetrahydrofolate reductase [Desulfovibrio sp. OttesenSCG-928-I05]
MKIIDRMQGRERPFYSLEFFPPKEVEQWPSFLGVVEKLKALDPLFASVTYGAGGGAQDNTLEIAAKIRAAGIEPLPHLTCVGASSARLAEFLTRLRAAGMDNVLALRGDAPKDREHWDWSAGEFSSALDLVGFMRREFPDFGVGVAGYPAPHPEAESFRSDRTYTKAKMDAGAEFIITQLFFDVREYIDMVERLREMGVTKPVIPAILPVQSLDSIRRVLSLCGASIPGYFYLELEDAHNKGGSAAVKDAGIRFAAKQIRRLIDYGAPGVHLYTLNRAETCLRLADVVGKL